MVFPMIRWMGQRNPNHQLKTVVNIPLFWMAFNHPFGGAGFLPSTVSSDIMSTEFLDPRITQDDFLDHLGRQSWMWIQTFRVYIQGANWELRTAGTTRGTNDLYHIGATHLQGLYLRAGTGNWGEVAIPRFRGPGYRPKTNTYESHRRAAARAMLPCLESRSGTGDKMN